MFSRVKEIVFIIFQLFVYNYKSPKRYFGVYVVMSIMPCTLWRAVFF